MNNFYRFLRYAALMAVMMPLMVWGQITPTTDTNGNGTIEDNEKNLYLIQTNQFESFYITPKGNNLNTVNLPHASMLWYFLEAENDNGTQYYYIVNNSTGNYICNTDYSSQGRAIGLLDFDNTSTDKFKFKFVENNPTGATGYYNIDIKPNGSGWLGLNKQSGNAAHDNGIRLTNSQYINQINSRWKFIPYNGTLNWPNTTFTASTNSEKHYYKIRNKKDNTYYISTNHSTSKVTYSSTVGNDMAWYVKEAPSSGLMKYYYIINPAADDKYMYYDGTATNGSNQSDAVSIKDINDANADADRFLFVIVQAAVVGSNDTPINGYYMIVPKLLIGNLWSSNSLGNNPPSNGSNMGIIPGRGADVYSHWSFEPTGFVAIAVPTITNNYDGTISLSTSTPGATIYYTTNGAIPDNTSTEYSSDFSLGDAKVIKAIAYLGSDYSDVSIYNVPKYTTPTISFDDNTSEVTITSEGTVYYNTGDGSQTDPTPSSGTQYSAPFPLSSATTVKAIATHAGYLTSDVATWSTAQEHDYSQDYLTFKILTAGTIAWTGVGGGHNKTIEYSIDHGPWTSITAATTPETITVSVNQTIRFRGLNTSYAKDKSNYSAFYEGTATYNAEGNIMSLIYGDNFSEQTILTAAWALSNVFNHSNLVSAENLIMPATTLTNDCYRATFANSPLLTTAPALPATTLSTECYYYMFDNCVSLIAAPELSATSLVSKCYYGMFHGCSSLNYIKCLVTNPNTTNTGIWVDGVAASGTFVKDVNTTTWSDGKDGIPTNWIVADEGTVLVDAPVISCDGEHVTITCATTGAEIYYRLGTSGNYCQYTTAITINANTTVQAYGELDGQRSVTTTQNCEYVSSVPIEESNRSLETWTYNGEIVTTPYSVNAIDGHSANYAKGTFNFETSFTLRSVQPTYLWFQHADQSAAVYIDNTLVEKHWGGYNSFFVDLSNHVHAGTNILKVALKNNEGNHLAPSAGDFNFNATLGNVKLFTSPVLPSMDYGYDGFHITATNVSSSAATLTIKTKVPLGATLVCKIDDDDSNYHQSLEQPSTGEDQTFTFTIANPILWNGTINPHLYTVTLEVYKDGDLYHRFQRDYGIRFFEYVINEPVGNENYTGFLLNGSPYLLRGVCMHDDLEGKANALNDDDYAQEFAIIQELGCNFIRLAHYPHPKEVYDWCDRLGIIVQTEVPCVNKMQSDLPQDYYDHLFIQYEDMVRQHYNHPCIVFWGLSNETTTDDKDFAKQKIEDYTQFIKDLDSERLVGYVMSHSVNNPSGYYNDPYNVDWFGCNIYVGWYIEQNSNNPTSQLNTRLNNTLTIRSKPLAFSEYGGGGTQSCHSDDYMNTTTRGNNPRHDIEYQMWLHEGHIAAIKNKPELLFTSQWQLFDIAVSNRTEGYKVCFDGGETVFENNELKYLNNKGLVERDHKTKKDTYYLYKAWWNQTDKFVHICGKDYKKLNDRAIKCYTNDGIIKNDSCILRLYVNDVKLDSVKVVDNIATFAARTFNPGDVIRVNGATSNDTFTFTNFSNDNVFTTNGNWNVNANWSGNAVPADGSDVVIMANATIPSGQTANADNIDLYGGSLTIADGGQLVSNNNPIVTAQKTITGYTIDQTNGEDKSDGWHFIASPIDNGANGTALSEVTNLIEGDYNLYRFNQSAVGGEWENQQVHNDFDKLYNKQGYLYANQETVTLEFTGPTKSALNADSLLLSYDENVADITKGWNLVGNPYVFNAYVNKDYYKINNDKNDLEPVSKANPIAPCTGVLVQASGTGQYVKFTKEAPATSSKGDIQMTLTQTVTNRGNSNVETLDKAVVSFNEDSQLGKFYFGTQDANIYMLENGKEFAIVSAQAQGEIPVNFNARQNGTYTITVNAEDVEMRYLHLIDNMTGADIDLLSTPSYTFSALNDDYTSRFRLVFSANMNENDNENENFAFFSNGNWIIANEGESTLQVIDITGRILSSKTINGSCSTTVNAASGVYVLRLVNGENVKTQKIVIR